MIAASFAWWEIPVGLGAGALLVWSLNRWVALRYDVDMIEELTQAFIDWANRLDDQDQRGGRS